MLRTSRLFASIAVVASLGAAACASKNTVASDTSGAEDVTNSEANAESLGASLIGSDGQSIATAADLTASNRVSLQDNGGTAGNPGFYFQPAGCLQVSVDKTKETASYAFNDCTGPLGLVHLTGTVNVSWQVASGKLTVNYSAQNFAINRATITSWMATAVVTASGNARTLTWNGQLSGTTGSGRSFQRTNQKTLSWTVGVPCLSLSGQSTGNVLKANLQTTIVSYKVCVDSCPEAGSEIQVKNLDNGDSIDIKYDGGPSATLDVNGKTEDIGLACGL